MKTSDIEQHSNFQAEFEVNWFRDLSVPRRKHQLENSQKWRNQVSSLATLGGKCFDLLLCYRVQNNSLIRLLPEKINDCMWSSSKVCQNVNSSQLSAQVEYFRYSFSRIVLNKWFLNKSFCNCLVLEVSAFFELHLFIACVTCMKSIQVFVNYQRCLNCTLVLDLKALTHPSLVPDVHMHHQLFFCFLIFFLKWIDFLVFLFSL